MNSLEHKTIIVTRPAHQAPPFIRQLREQGATVIKLPTINILFRQHAITEQEQNFLNESSLWIFTSVNAVSGANQLGAITEKFQAKIACIGLSTAAALKNLGIEPDYVPDKNSNSEGLLSLLDGVDTPVVAIIQGGVGRDTLRQELTRRGSTVHGLDVYQRHLPEHQPILLNTALEALPCTISITSNQGLVNLMELVPISYRERLFKSDLVVNSSRCAVFARELSFLGKVEVADPPGNQGQLHALLRL